LHMYAIQTLFTGCGSWQSFISCCFLWSYRDTQNILLQLITSTLQSVIISPGYPYTSTHSLPSRSFALVFWTAGLASWWQNWNWTKCKKEIFKTETFGDDKNFKQPLHVRCIYITEIQGSYLWPEFIPTKSCRKKKKVPIFFFLNRS
jgi:hypothetical protein